VLPSALPRLQGQPDLAAVLLLRERAQRRVAALG